MKTIKVLAWILILAIGFFAGVSWKKMEKKPTGEEVTSEAERETPEEESPVDLGLGNGEKKTIRLFEKSAPSVCFITTSNVRRDFFSRNIMEVPREPVQDLSGIRMAISLPIIT